MPTVTPFKRSYWQTGSRFILAAILVAFVSLPHAQAKTVHSGLTPAYDMQRTMKGSAYYDLHQASVLMDAGLFEEALPYLEKSVEKNPSSLVAVFNLGVCQMQLAEKGQDPHQQLALLNEAETTFVRANSMNPDMVITYFKLGKIALIKGNNALAAEYYEQALAKEPDNAVLHFNVAGVYDEINQYDEAIDHYKKAIALQPDFIYAYNNLGLVYEIKKDHKNAEAAYRKALKINQQYNYARLNLGNLLAEQEQYESAKRLYREALKYEPNNAWPHLYLGNVHFQQKDYRSAAREYALSIEKNPTYTTAYYLQAVCLQKLGRTDEALISSLKYISLSPKGRYANDVMALILNLKLENAAASNRDGK